MVAQTRRIAYFYERPDTSTFRYRVFNPGQTLAADPACGVSGSWFDHRDLVADDSFIDAADALVICRARYNARIARMVARARARGARVLFDCDDLVFDIARLHMLMDTLNLNQSSEAVWDDWFAKVSRSWRDHAPLRRLHHPKSVLGGARQRIRATTSHGYRAKLSQSCAAGVVATLPSYKAGIRLGERWPHPLGLFQRVADATPVILQSDTLDDDLCHRAWC